MNSILSMLLVVWAGKSWKELNVQGKEQRYVVSRFGSRELNDRIRAIKVSSLLYNLISIYLLMLDFILCQCCVLELPPDGPP